MAQKFYTDINMVNNRITNLPNAENPQEPVTLSQVQSLGVSDKTYIHHQLTPSMTWSINHGLSKFPSVSVVDSARTLVVGEINYVDNNNITVTFGASFSGNAYLN